MTVSPVVNCGDFECAQKRFEAASAIGAPAVHLDVSDGVFSPVKTGGTPEDLKKLLAEFPGIEAHVHLMVANPENFLEEWINAGAKRVIVHVEAVSEFNSLRELNSNGIVELFLGLKKETPASVLDGFLDEPGLKGVHMLAVPIGYSGGKFDEGILEKIKYVKLKAPRLIVSVDGGVNPDVARAAKAVGADEIVSSTYIFGSPDPQRAYENLTRI